jgi:hypothetical protein
MNRYDRGTPGITRPCIWLLLSTGLNHGGIHIAGCGPCRAAPASALLAFLCILSNAAITAACASLSLSFLGFHNAYLACLRAYTLTSTSAKR